MPKFLRVYFPLTQAAISQVLVDFDSACWMSETKHGQEKTKLTSNQAISWFSGPKKEKWYLHSFLSTKKIYPSQVNQLLP